MKRVLVLSSSSADGKRLLWCLREAGYSADVMGNDSKNMGLRYSPLFKKFYAIPECYSFKQRSFEILAFMASVVQQACIDIIIPSGFDSVKFISQYQNEMRNISHVMAVPSLDTMSLLGNKFTFSVFCAENNIPHPRTFLLKNAQDIFKKDLPVSFPLVTKPLEMSSSYGIYPFENKDALHKYIASQRKDAFNALPLLLQEFIPGEDIDFNGFCSSGKVDAWTIQRFIAIKIGKKTPLRWMQFIDHKDVYKISERIVATSNYSGPIHIDLRIDSRDGSVKTLEVNPRFWATTFASICDGINFADVGIRKVFDSAYVKMPRCDGRVLDMPFLMPILFLKNRKIKFRKYIAQFTFVQVKYLVLDVFFSVVAFVRGRFSRNLEKV